MNITARNLGGPEEPVFIGEFVGANDPCLAALADAVMRYDYVRIEGNSKIFICWRGSNLLSSSTREEILRDSWYSLSDGSKNQSFYH